MKLTWSSGEYTNMKTVTKVSIELTNEEYDTIIKAQEIMADIASELDDENLMDDDLSEWFDNYDCVVNILGKLREGIERKDGE